MIDLHRLETFIRDVPDFPKPGIVFKDITPLLKNPTMCRAVVNEITQAFENTKIDVVAGVESRGFLFGMMIASVLNVPFVPIRKSGKLPYQTIKQSYDLEYGAAEIEVHIDAFAPGQKVLIHDDLLATGGTVGAVAKLVTRLDAEVAGFSFLISLDVLNGINELQKFSCPIHSVLHY